MGRPTLAKLEREERKHRRVVEETWFRKNQQRRQALEQAKAAKLDKLDKLDKGD